MRHSRFTFWWTALVLLGSVAVEPVLGQSAAPQEEYHLVPGDILKITVFKNPDLSLDARVSEGGSIAYPLVGAVPVGGLSLPAAERKIAQSLKDGGFVVAPEVNILLTQAYGNLVSVIGSFNTRDVTRWRRRATGCRG